MGKQKLTYLYLTTKERGTKKMNTNFANLNMEINDDVVKTIFSSALNQAVFEAMGDKEKYIEALINSAFQQKVDSSGKVSSYSRENKYVWLDIVVKKTIQEAAEESIKEYLEENKELLKLAVKEEMEKEENKSALVNSFVKGATNTFDYNYRFNASVDIKPDSY